MLKSCTCTLIILMSFTAVMGQAPATKKDDPAKAPNSAAPAQPKRDTPFPSGINLVYLIKELARDLDINVLFDPESRLEPRVTRIQMKNVTAAEALNYLLLQEGLIAENVGPRTILVVSNLRAKTIPQIGIGLTPLTAQLDQYFGVEGGTLINDVRPDSPAAKAGLKAGDVITEVDGMPIRAGTLFQAVKNRNGADLTLRISRDRKPRRVIVTLPQAIE